MKITKLDASMHESRRFNKRKINNQLRNWINLYATIATMPGYGHLASSYIRGDIDKDSFIKFLIVGEYRRINEPKNGQGRLAKINNALHVSKSQVAAYMFGEYASWYTAGWDGLHACQDTFKPLGGTTGYFCTEPVEEVYWQEEKVKKVLLRDGCKEDIDHIKRHYESKNKLLAIGGWDEFQVAEDYMLGMVLWWRGFNVSAFWSLTPEDPAGFESELGFKYRPKQISRWNKGYIMGLLMATESWQNFSEIGKRKGLWGYITFFIPTLGSAVHPFLFRIAVAFSLFWWIYFLPIRKTWEILLASRFGLQVSAFNDYTNLLALFEKIQKAIGIYTPRVLNFFSIGGWAWIIGPSLVLVPLFIYKYFTMRGIFKGVDDYLGLKRILEEYDYLINQIKDMAVGTDKEKGVVINSALGEIEERKIVVSNGSLKEVRGVVSFHKYLLLMCLFMASCIAIFVSPAMVWLLPIMAGLAAVFYFVIMIVVKLYLSSAKGRQIRQVKERAVRAMRLRAAMPNFFIDFYHMIYLAGNKIAWQEVINGGRIGYWWRTPRAVDIVDEVVQRHEQYHNKKEKNYNPILFFKKIKHYTNQADIETSLEGFRLTTQLFRYYGFMLLMTWILIIGLRYGIQDYIFSQILFQTLFRNTPTVLSGGLIAVCGLLIFLVIWKIYCNIKLELNKWNDADESVLEKSKAIEGKIQIGGILRFVTPVVVLSIVTILIPVHLAFRDKPIVFKRTDIANPEWIYSNQQDTYVSEEDLIPIETRNVLRENFDLNIGTNIKGSFHDVGMWSEYSRAGWATREGSVNLEKQLRALAKNGSNLIRYMPVLGDLRAGIVKRGDYIEFDKTAPEDVAVFFFILDKVRKDYPDLQVIPTLFSFEIADGVSREDGVEVGEYPQIFKDPTVRSDFINELDNLFNSYWNHEGVYAWDIFNEPNLAWKLEIKDVKDFVNELGLRIHEAGGDITIGCQTLDDMIYDWSNEVTLDLLQFHIYSKNVAVLESVSDIRKKINNSKELPILIGEWGLTDKNNNGRKATIQEIEKMLSEAKSSGYHGALIWVDDYYGLQKNNSNIKWLDKQKKQKRTGK